MQVSDNMVFPLGLRYDLHTWPRAPVVVQLAIGQASLAFGCDWRPAELAFCGPAVGVRF